MSEVVLGNFPKLIKNMPKNNSYSWASVFDVLLRHEGIRDIQHEDIVMLSGEGFAFSYSPYHYAPMYLGLLRHGERVRNMFGYSVKWLRGPALGGDVEKAWEFIKNNLDLGHGIHVEGPESFLIYGYNDSGKKEKRILKCIAKWGPGLDGDVTWEQFSSCPVLFSFSSLTKTNNPLSAEENIHLLVRQMHKYQVSHPGIGSKFQVHHEVKDEDMKGKEIILSQENYGLASFKQLIKDIQNKDTVRAMLPAYLYCHAMNFHFWGRQWQGKWFKKQASKFDGELAVLFNKVADAYFATAKSLEEFTKINAANFETHKLYDNIKESLPSLKKAFEHEKLAVSAIAEITDKFVVKESVSLEDAVRETLFAGMGAGDTHMDPFTALEGLREEDLHKKPADNVMSIWEQVTHLQFWQELTIQNIKEGKPHWSKVDWSKYPPDYKAKYGDWKTFHKAVCATFIEIQQIIKDEDDPSKRYPEIDNVSFAHLARFLCSHMSYHIAQIVMTRKILGNWPPLGRYTSYHLIG